MNKKAAELKRYAVLARRAGHPVPPSTNGGGWVDVATACGMTEGGKGAAKLYLLKLFGPMPAAELAALITAKPAYTKADKKAFSLRLVKPAPTASLPFEATDAFLQSFAWRKARMKALATHGARCQCCGASPAATGAVMNVDHIKPRKTHPELALDQSNLQILCHECNHGKGNWDQTDWRAKA